MAHKLWVNMKVSVAPTEMDTEKCNCDFKNTL